MAKFRTAIISAALFCLFTISLARAPPELTTTAAQVALPLRDADPDLRLPSEPINTDSDAKTNTEMDPNFAVVSSAPMTKITFRPVNRLFLKRPCRHHFKFYPTMRDNHQIPYGNDMLIASAENTDFKQPAVRGGGKRIPGQWMRMHHHHLRRRSEDTDNEEEDDRVKKIVFKRYDYDRFDREKKLKKLRQRFRIGNEKKEEKPKKSPFFKGVRKFLNNYF